MHRNLSETYHVHHAGRSEYTLLYPPTADTPARVEHVVMGSDAARGEVKQVSAPRPPSPAIGFGAC